MPNLAVAPSTPAAAPALAGEVTASAPKKRSGFSFHDFLDTINPLQHIPVISTIYRAITGDKPSAIADILGGALFGGPIGAASAAINRIIEDQTGDDIGGHLMATLGLTHHDATGTTAVTKPSTGASAMTSSKTGIVKPVPAFLVAEAAADRQAGGNPATGANAGQPTAFWLSMQRGGAGIDRSVIPQAHQGVTVGPPKALLDAIAASRAQPTVSAASTNPDATSNAAAARAFDSQTAIQTTAANPATASAIPPASPDRAQAQAAAIPGIPQPAPRQAIPDLMMQALSKYQALHRAPQSPTVDQVH